MFVVSVVIVLAGGVFIKDQFLRLTVISLGFLISSISCLFLGKVTMNNQFKNRIKPIIKVECLDKVCDTTYIYNFNKTK